MTKFAYNNAKNSNIKHIFLELIHGYYSKILYKKILNLYLKVK